MFLQNYSLDIGYTYSFTLFSYKQTLVIDTVVNENPIVVLQTLLPTISGQLITVNDGVFCPLRQGLRTRQVEIELASNNTKYAFDIPWNSNSDALHDALLVDLDNILIKSWKIIGEKVTSRLTGLLLTKVP